MLGHVGDLEQFEQQLVGVDVDEVVVGLGCCAHRAGHTPHPLKPRDVENTVGRRLSPAFASHPLNGADSLGPHADEAVVFEDVAEFVLAERIGPGDR
jgi:hypothetical protein